MEEAKSFGWIKEHALWGPISQILATLAQSFPELTPTISVGTGVEIGPYCELLFSPSLHVKTLEFAAFLFCV